MNSCVLVGRLGRDPQLRYTQTGVPVTTFSIAVDRPVSAQHGEQAADWIDIVAWRQQAEFAANYLYQGRLVAVQGRIQTRTWQDKVGQTRKTVEIVADRIEGLDRPTQAQSPEGVLHTHRPPDKRLGTPVTAASVGHGDAHNDDLCGEDDPFAE